MTTPTLRTARRDDLARFVTHRVSELAAGALAQTGTAQATLAALRRAAGDEPMSDPSVWWVIDGLEPADAPDALTDAERAAFHALTLFAVHQQSRPEPMHRAGVGFGQAVKLLDARRGDAGSLKRRFAAAAGADGEAELVVHLRSLVQQLRAEAIPTDYAALAKDLMDFATPDGRVRVRQRWGRQMFRREQRATDPTSTTADDILTDQPSEGGVA